LAGGGTPAGSGRRYCPSTTGCTRDQSRSAPGSLRSLEEDLRTGIADAEYNIAFEIDQMKLVNQEGWSVVIQGSAHFVDSEAGLASVAGLLVQAWAGGPKERFSRIIPTCITRGRIRRTSETTAG
jgi:hypothetical protein